VAPMLSRDVGCGDGTTGYSGTTSRWDRPGSLIMSCSLYHVEETVQSVLSMSVLLSQLGSSSDLHLAADIDCGLKGDGNAKQKQDDELHVC